MKKAVVFDLYETLVTEWDSEKFTSSQCSALLGVDPALYRTIWDESHTAMDTGAVRSEEVLRRICRESGRENPEEQILACMKRRTDAKAQCFARPRAEVLSMLKSLKEAGFLLALCSNCSADEVAALPACALYPFFDTVILSYEVGLRKPDTQIYQLCAERLGVPADNCIFIGDGASRELYGAKEAGMHPLRAAWFLKGEVKPMPFPLLQSPAEALQSCLSLQ